jgi:Tol biopolymer transport system component
MRNVLALVLLVLPFAATAAGATIVRPAPGSAIVWGPGQDVTFEPAGGGIYVVGADGSGLRRLTSMPNSDDLDWSPDGRTLLFSRDVVIYELRAGGQIIRVAKGAGARWSPDGRRIAFSGNGGFYVSRADGTGAVLVAKSRYTESAGPPAWSPDGRYIAYVACRAAYGSWGCEHASAFDVYVSRVTGGPRRRLTSKPGFPICVTWSRTGWLAWSTGSGRTALMRPGGRVRLVLPAGGCPVWSPDGRRFVVSTTTRAGDGLGFLNADGTGRHYLTLTRPSGPTLGTPAWSADGQSLAVPADQVTASQTDFTYLYTLDADGSHLRRILPAATR